MSNYVPPPIPDPHNTSGFSRPVTLRGDWKTAPPIVRGWAYPLTWLGLILLPFVILAGLVEGARSPFGLDGIVGVILFGGLWCVDLWLNRALKRGDRNAWPVQIVLSVFGLLGFPLGTLIHGYVLSQWFKPETKAWFGR